jgi:PAS domain S-box-containing protein
VYKDGAVIGASLFGREITEQKEAEKKLLESERRFRELAETIQDVFYILDAGDFSAIYVSPAYEKVYGRPVRSVYENPRSWLDAVHPDDRPMILERQASLMREFPETYVGPDHRVVRPDGGVAWIQNRSYLIRNEAGEPDRIIGVVKDITGRKEAERSLGETTSRLEALFKTFPDLLFITEKDGTILDFRSGDSDNLYVPPEEFLGRKIQNVLPPEIGEMAVEAFTALHRTHEPQSVECWLDVPSGHKAFETRLIEIDDTLIAVIGRDITERKTAEEEVRKAHAELEMRVLERTEALHKSNQELRHEILARKKTEEAYRRAEKLASIGTLAAGIAHEVNNPLGSILMAADNAVYAVENPEELADAREALMDIKDEAKRAGRIVKTVLQFSRKDESHRELFDLGDVIRNACKICNDPAAERGVLIRHRVTVDRTRINMNPAEMEQAFVNVISNAVEASSQGQTVSVHLNGRPDRIEAVVADSGRGMTKEQTARIFDPFYTTRQAEGGTGLGLSLTHTIISHHGGTIEVDSTPGEGTRVIISMPARGETEADEETQ